MNTNFKIGDKIIIKNIGHGYTTYTQMYDLLKSEDSKPYAYNESLPSEHVTTVKNIGKHEFGCDKIILFEDDNNSYLVSIRGVDAVKEKKKAYFIIDGSGSMDELKEWLELVVDTMSKDYDYSKIIVHSTEAKFGTINDIGIAGGTFLSSGLSLALNDSIMNGRNFSDTTFVILTDGGNWIEDNDRFINSLKFSIDSGINVKYMELRPLVHTETMFKKLERENINKDNFNMEQLCDIHQLRDRLGLPKLSSYTIYEVEHKVNGKRYNFRSNCQLREGEIAVCKTTYGYCYGLIKAVKKVKLTKTAYEKLKKCTYLSDDIKSLKRR